MFVLSAGLFCGVHVNGPANNMPQIFEMAFKRQRQREREAERAREREREIYIYIIEIYIYTHIYSPWCAYQRGRGYYKKHFL